MFLLHKIKNGFIYARDKIKANYYTIYTVVGTQFYSVTFCVDNPPVAVQQLLFLPRALVIVFTVMDKWWRFSFISQAPAFKKFVKSYVQLRIT